MNTNGNSNFFLWSGKVRVEPEDQWLTYVAFSEPVGGIDLIIGLYMFIGYKSGLCMQYRHHLLPISYPK